MPESKITVKAENQASEVLNTISEDLGRLADSGERISTIGTAAAVVTAGFVAVKGAIASVEFVLDKVRLPLEQYIEFRDATRGLTEQQIEWARQVELTVGLQDTAAASLLRLSGTLGVVEAMQDDVVLAAQGLSEALGIGVDMALRKVSEAVTSNSRALDSLIPSLKSLETEEEKLAEIQRVVASGLEESREKMTELEGAKQRYQKRSENLGRVIGEFLEPALTVFYNSLSDLKDLIAQNVVPVLEGLFQMFGDEIQRITFLVTTTESWTLALVNLERQALNTEIALAKISNNFLVRQGDEVGLQVSRFGPEQNAMKDEIEGFIQWAEGQLKVLDNEELEVGRALAEKWQDFREKDRASFLEWIKEIAKTSSEEIVPVLDSLARGFSLDLAPELEKAGKEKGQRSLPDLQAVESRLRLFGPSKNDFDKQTADNTKKAVGKLEKIVEQQSEWIAAMQRTLQPDAPANQPFEVIIVE